MPLTDQEVIDLARALWPKVTVEAADNAFLTARLPLARVRASEGRFPDSTLRDTATALMLAHYAYRLNPAKLLPSQFSDTAGESTTVSEGSASIGAVRSDVDYFLRELAKTPPGLEFLELLHDTQDRLAVGGELAIA